MDDEPPDAIPHRLRDRARRAGRLVAGVVGASARRLVKPSIESDRQLGVAMLGQLDEMKGMAMKVGQILSYMDGALPAEAQDALRQLQTGAAPLAWSTIEGVIEGALGAPVDQLFDRIEPIPIAAASIGQVHRAWLGGRPLAVKVQYPRVRETFDADVKQLHRIAGLASAATRVDGRAIVEDLHARLREECDYAHEARWQAAFREMFADDPRVVIPEVIADRSCARVLTSAWAPGEDLYTFAASAGAGERAAAGAVLATFAWRSLFGRGVIQADPHPGNFRFPGGGRVVCLDFGCVRAFPAAFLAPQAALARVVIDDRRGDFRAAALATGMIAAPRGFDAVGFDAVGFDAVGFDAVGFDAVGFDAVGFDAVGFDAVGFDAVGFDAVGFDAVGFDFDEWWAFYRWLYRPYCAPGFRFTGDYNREGMKYTGPTSANMRKVAIPPAWIWLARLQAGLHAVLAKLGAEGDFRAILEAALAEGEAGAAPPAIGPGPAAG